MSLITNNFAALNISEPSASSSALSLSQPSTSTFSFDTSSSLSSSSAPTLFRKKVKPQEAPPKKAPQPSSTFSFDTSSTLSSSQFSSKSSSSPCSESSTFSFDTNSSLSPSAPTLFRKKVNSKEASQKKGLHPSTRSFHSSSSLSSSSNVTELFRKKPKASSSTDEIPMLNWTPINDENEEQTITNILDSITVCSSLRNISVEVPPAPMEDVPNPNKKHRSS